MGFLPGKNSGIFALKDVSAIKHDTEGEQGLKRSVNALNLTALGVGAIIGTGIFVVIGEGIGEAGPAVVVSFALAV